MTDPLSWFGPMVRRPAEAVRWACILEATAPKAGNVYPGRPFDNLGYIDFVEAAEIAARSFAEETRFSEAVLSAVLKTAERRGTNVNLGILLLLGPLVAADRRLTAEGCLRPKSADWKDAIATELKLLGPADGQNVFRAISSASAGGLGHVDSMDVRDAHATIDLVAAMSLAADRDRIARQYAEGFADLVDHIAPQLHSSISQCGDVLRGISLTHVRMLADSPDSLIARKNGPEVASRIQSKAKATDLDDSASLDQLDASLRTPDHRFNPGTTADLIAAGLYLLLRSLESSRSPSPT